MIKDNENYKKEKRDCWNNREFKKPNRKLKERRLKQKNRDLKNNLKHLKEHDWKKFAKKKKKLKC